MLKFAHENSVLNTTNREWTTTEEADLTNYTADDLMVEIEEDMAVVSRTGRMDDPYLVQVFAVADNVYIGHQAYAAKIYATNNLKDCLDFAAEAVYTA